MGGNASDGSMFWSPDRSLAGLTFMRAVQITRFGGPEVPGVVDIHHCVSAK
jgi:hypothetical protein